MWTGRAEPPIQAPGWMETEGDEHCGPSGPVGFSGGLSTSVRGMRRSSV